MLEVKSLALYFNFKEKPVLGLSAKHIIVPITVWEY
jgi:hypothetical protein